MLSSNEYRTIFEAAPDGVVVVDSSGVIRDVNPQMETLFGYAREELLGETVEMLIPDAFRRAHEEHRGRYARNPHNRPMGVGLDLRGLRKEGTEFPVEISLSPLGNDRGTQVICTVRDVSERKRLRDFSEGALRSVEEERQRIARELHDDTAQRLATLMLRVRMLCQEKDHRRRETMLEEIRQEILDAADGVKRIARGLRPPELEDVGLRTALLSHVRGLREGTGFKVEAELEKVGHLLTDEGKLVLYRVVQEALSNAVRHSGADRARLSVVHEEDSVVAVVEDEGRGFASVAVSAGGGGLGLVGMQERAVMIGGRVTVDSAPGEGTRVRIELPAVAVEAQNA